MTMMTMMMHADCLGQAAIPGSALQPRHYHHCCCPAEPARTMTMPFGAAAATERERKPSQGDLILQGQCPWLTEAA